MKPLNATGCSEAAGLRFVDWVAVILSIRVAMILFLNSGAREPCFT